MKFIEWSYRRNNGQVKTMDSWVLSYRTSLLKDFRSMSVQMVGH